MSTILAPVTVGGFTFGVLAAGADVVYDQIEGWHSGPGVRSSMQAKVGADGAYDSRPLRDARVVTLSGWVYADQRAALADVLDRLCALFADGQAQQMSVADIDVGTRSASVRLSGEPLVDWSAPDLATWQVSFTAPDPVKYGAELVQVTGLADTAAGVGLLYPMVYPLDYGAPVGASTGQLLVGNAGTVPFWPRLRVVGPAARPRIWIPETGSEVLYDRDIPAGQHVDFLLRDRRVLAQGVASRRFAVEYVGDWLSIPPGGASIAWEADAYDPAAQLWCWAPAGAWL